MYRYLQAPIADMWPNSGSPVTVSTSTSYVLIDRDTEMLSIIGDNDFRLRLSPRIKVAWRYDASEDRYGDGVNWGDYNTATDIQDGSTSTVMALLSMPPEDKIYAMTEQPCLGLYIDVSDQNSNISTLTAKYFNGTDFVDASATDGTLSSGKTFGQDGAVTWSAKTDEVPTTVNGKTGYWYELSVSATLSYFCTVAEIQALSKRGWNIIQASEAYTLAVNMEAVVGLELSVEAVTSTVQITNTKY